MTTTLLGPGGTRAEWNLNVNGPKTQYLNAINTAETAAIACSSDGTVVLVVVANSALAPICYLSTDGGYTFTATAANPSQIGPSLTTPSANLFSAFVTDANTFAVAYQTTTLAVFSKTTNGGTSWTTNTGSTGGTSTAPCGASKCTDASTAFYIMSNSTTSVRYAKTSNSGSSFSTGVIATETVVGNHAAIATTDSATVYAFWFNTTTTLRWSSTTNSGSSWAAAANIATDNNTSSTAMGLAAFAKTTTNAYFAYRQTGTPAALKVLVTTNGTSWSTAFDTSGEPITTTLLGANGDAVAAIGATPDGTVYLTSRAVVSATILSKQYRLSWTTDSGATWTHRKGSVSATLQNTSNGAVDEGPVSTALCAPTNHSILIVFGQLSAASVSAGIHEFRRQFYAPG